MRTQGTLAKWNEDRGFGFIRTRDTGIDLFAHVSQFPRGGRRPQVGDPVSFEIRTADDGRKQAHAIAFDVPVAHAPSAPRGTPARRRAQKPGFRPPRGRRRGALFATLAFTGMLAIGGFAYRSVTGDDPAAATTAPMAASPPLDVKEIADRCGNRTQCNQMRSCSDATWVLRHCPGTQMDGDGDGIPCEQQWCR